MGLRIRIGLLICLAMGAVFTGMEAVRTPRPEKSEVIPETVYAQYGERAENAEFFLRAAGGYVAVYTGQKEKEPVTVTAIEVSNLRGQTARCSKRASPSAIRASCWSFWRILGRDGS